MKRPNAFHKGILGTVRNYAIPTLAALWLSIHPMKANAETIEGRVTDASIATPTGIPTLLVNVSDIGEVPTDDEGNYRITSNGVWDVKYEIPKYNDGFMRIFNLNGQLVDKLSWNGTPQFWNKNVAAGTYFAFDGVNPVYQFNNVGSGAWVNPTGNLENRTQNNEKGKGKVTLSMDENHNLYVSGIVNLDSPQGENWGGYRLYHDFLRNINVNDVLEYNVQMIPVMNADDNTDGSRTILDVLKLLTVTDGSGLNTTLERWHDEDLPIPVYLSDYSVMREGLDVIVAFQHASDDIFVKSGHRLYDMNFREDSVNVGINVYFRVPPHGIGWTQPVEFYEDGAPKLIDIFIDPGINSQELLELVVLREKTRGLILFDRSHDERYVTHFGGTSVRELHPNEGKALRIMYNINPVEYNGETSWPDMNWYQSNTGNDMVDYDYSEGKE